MNALYMMKIVRTLNNGQFELLPPDIGNAEATQAPLVAIVEQLASLQCRQDHLENLLTKMSAPMKKMERNIVA